MNDLISKRQMVEKINDLFLDKYEAKANSDLTEFYKEVLKILINEKGQSNWISAKDRLPDKGGKYLVCGDIHLWDIEKYRTNECVVIAKFTERKEWLTSLSVKYWMLLPELPKENDAE